MPPPGSSPAPFYYSRIFIVVAGILVGILIGLLIGWVIDEGTVDIHEGTPTFSSYDSLKGVITLPATLPNTKYWVTSEMLGDANKGLTITSSGTTTFTPHYSCTGGPASFWKLPGVNSYQLTPLYDPALCTTSPPPPTTPITTGITGAVHTLVTKTGTLTVIDPTGRPVTCQVDVYTFTDTSGNTSCITIVLMSD